MGYRTHGLKYLSLNPLKIRPEYYVWMTMKSRCLTVTHAQYKNYGGRGITVCNEWLSFEFFFKDMEQRPSSLHSLDRIENDKGYFKTNCRWALKEVQDNNKRTNVFIEFKGEKMTISQWAKKINLNVDTLWKRLNVGWSIEKCLTKPHRYKKVIE